MLKWINNELTNVITNENKINNNIEIKNNENHFEVSFMIGTYST